MEYNRDEIHLLLIEKICGTIDTEDEVLVDRLIREEPAVADMWRSLKDIFSTPEGREALDTVRHEAFTEKVEHSFHRSRRRRIYRRGIGYAAAALLLLSVLSWWYLLHTAPAREVSASPDVHVQLQLGNGRTICLDDYSPQTILLGNARLRSHRDTLTYTAAGNGMVNTLVVPPGKQYTLVLSDGTEIRLNAATSLSFPFTFKGRKREVTINGEAYFKIARRAGHPFIVHTPQSTIEVLGTTFNVNTYSKDSMTVSLLDGALRVKAGNSVRTLEPGCQAVYKRQKNMQIKAFDSNEVLSWLNGEFIFHDTELQHLTGVISRWYGVNVIVDNPAIADKRFSGVISKKKPLCIFLEQLQKTSEVRSHYNGNELHFR
jgi:ferric-dicitrate binding protein FerR (iron transport regulator)